MANTNINIRMDADLKRQFEAFCADMGMTMTTAFNVFARKAVREYSCLLYTSDTGKESTISGRCGVMDGEITSTVDDLYLKGLGENPVVQDLYIAHARFAAGHKAVSMAVKKRNYSK